MAKKNEKNDSWKRLGGPEQMGLRSFAKNYQKVSMKFGQFSNSSTSYPKLTTQIRIAPASGIEIVSFG